MSLLHGAYSSGSRRDGIRTFLTIRQRTILLSYKSDIKGATLAAMEPKVSKCDSIKNNWHAG